MNQEENNLKPKKSTENLNLSINYLNLLENKIDQHNYQIKRYPKSDNAAVIVEPREHQLLKPIIKCINYFCNINPKLNNDNSEEYASNFNIYLIGGNKTKLYIETLFSAEDLKNIIFIDMEIDNINADQHNYLLQQEIFWQQFREEHILIFQTDSYMFRSIPKKYLDYDFVGALTVNKFSRTPNGYSQNGGFSLRKRSSMIEAIKRVTYQDMNRYRNSKNLKDINDKIIAEDIYFWHALELTGKKLLEQKETPNFSIETYPDFPLYMGSIKPIGIHAFDKNMLSPNALNSIIVQSIRDNILFSN